MNMKSLLTVMAMIAVATVYAQPQGGRAGANMTPEQRAEMMAKRMKTELNLTDEQTEAVKQLNLKNMPNQGERPDEEARKKMREERDAELKKILTDEQFTKWQEAQKNRMQRGQGMQPRDGKGESADQRMNRMKEDLSLTDDQVAKLKALNEGRQQEMMKMGKEKSAEYEQQIQQILTPEQYAKMQEMRKEYQKKNPQAASSEKKKK